MPGLKDQKSETTVPGASISLRCHVQQIPKGRFMIPRDSGAIAVAVTRVTYVALASGTYDDRVHVNIERLLDGKSDRPSNGI